METKFKKPDTLATDVNVALSNRKENDSASEVFRKIYRFAKILFDLIYM